MPHRRKRHLERVLKKVLRMSPLVGVLGHRQVGKTTLLELISDQYFSMDDSRELISATAEPKKYLEERAGKATVALDECQSAPELFPALKEWVRKHPRPGQFLLSGSVRFTSRKAIQESLTGRIVLFELLPMLLSELHEEPLPDFWRKALRSESWGEFTQTKRGKRRTNHIEHYFRFGGLPGICFIRDDSFRERKLDTQIETILDRDLRKIIPINIPYPQLRRLLQALADRQGELFSWTDLRSDSGISVPTLKRVLYALEGVFLIRTVLVEGDVKGPVYFFEDLGEFAFLRTKKSSLLEKITHLLMVHIRGELSYGFSSPFRIFQYRTRAGVCVPIVIQEKESVLGVIPIEKDYPSRSENAAADSLLKRYAHSRCLFIHPETSMMLLSDRKLIVPLSLTV